jgi:hypothetical protein
MGDILNFIKENWVTITVVYLAFAKFITAIRDVLDKTPASDDNWFERIVTIINKLGGYLLTGQRPK